MRPRYLRKPGYTIVEMLVVVAIIATLMGLLFPAVQAARESGRRTACTANQTQIALAINSHDQAKGYIPGWRNSNPAGTVQTPSWPIPILPYAERNDVYQSWTQGNTPSAYLSTFVCSSAVVGSTTQAVLSYAGNAGSLANTRKWDGVMLDTTFSDTGRIDMEDIAQGDGTATTLLLAEKSATGTGLPQQLWGAIMPLVPASFAATPAFGITVDLSASARSNNLPSSNHSSVVVVAFCDGHAMALRTDIDTKVYAQLITSKNSKASVYARKIGRAHV